MKRIANKKMIPVLLFFILFGVVFALVYVKSQSMPKDDSKAVSVQTMVQNMTLEEKIAQTFMMAFRVWGPEGQEVEVLPDKIGQIIQKYHFGSIILFTQNMKTTKNTFNLTRAMQKAAISDNGIPLLIATDQEGGSVYRLGSGTSLPGNMAIAATGDPDNAKKNGEIIAKELSSVGINTTFAPDMDVNDNANNPVIGLRAFSDQPDIVSQYGIAEMKGLSENNVIACVKHFPGHGNTATDSHYGLPVVKKNREELNAVELAPFREAVNAGAEMIMTAHILFPNIDDSKIFSEKTQQKESRPATLSKKIVTGILREEMGYNGVVITDSLEMEGITDFFDQDQAAVEALKAGVDLLCIPISLYSSEDTQALDELIASVKDSVLSDDANSLTEERLNEAVTRILTLKKDKGILSYDPDDHSLKDALNTVGSSDHRAIENEMAEKSITIVKNQKDTLPCQVKDNAKIMMMSPKSDTDPLPASMLMGWNRVKAKGLIPDSAQIRYYEFDADDAEDQTNLKAAVDWADIVIVCSKVYDVDDMAYEFLTSQCPLKITDYCHQKGKKSIVMSVSKPYDAQLYPNADAVIAVYNYIGSSEDPDEVLEKGITQSDHAAGPNVIAGIEAVFGAFNPSGKLPIAIPRFDAATKTFDSSDLVFQRGYGLSYEK